MFSELTNLSKRMLVSGIFKQLMTFIGVIDVLNIFSAIWTYILSILF